MAILLPPSPNTCNSNLILPLPQGGTNCAGFDVTQGYVTEVTDAQNGIYFDVITQTEKEYVNPSEFPLQVASLVCVSTIDETTVMSFSNVFIHTVQYFIDNVPITSVTPINTAMTFAPINSIQFFINLGITNPNATITVNNFDFFTGLDVTITLSTMTAVVESKVVVNPPPLEQPDTYTSTFTCNIEPVTPKKRKRKILGGILPYIDVTVPSEIAVPQFINYGGFIFVNPVLKTSNLNLSKSDISKGRFVPPIPSQGKAVNLNFSKTNINRYGGDNTQEESESGKADLVNNIYRYTNTLISDRGGRLWVTNNFRIGQNNPDFPSNPPSTVGRPPTNPINSAKLVCDNIAGKSCCRYDYYDIIGIYIGNSGWTCSS